MAVACCCSAKLVVIEVRLLLHTPACTSNGSASALSDVVMLALLAFSHMQVLLRAESS